MRVVIAFSLFVSVAGCSKPPLPVKTNPCDLLSVSEAQSIDGTITATQRFPPKKGETDELCVYQDAKGEARLMLFVWRDKSANPMKEVKVGMKDARDKIVEVGGIGDRAAAGFSGSDGTLKLLAARTKLGMVGLRVRDPVKEGDEKYNNVKLWTGKALDRLK